MDRINNDDLPHFDLSGKVIGCCIEIMRVLGSGFLENVYKNALYIAMKAKGMNIVTEKSFEIYFQGYTIGRYIADLIVEDLLILELKCCRALTPEHQVQLINYLKAADKEVGLLVNFGNQRLEYKRLHHPDLFTPKEEVLSQYMLP